MKEALQDLADRVRSCRLCADSLPLGPRPVIQVDSRARILVAGQAPGTRVQASGIPFDDPSGERLRSWMGIDRGTFYDATRIAIVPMGFCYPGKGKSGDLPPLPICAETWREQILQQLKHIQLTLVIGQYALAYHLPDAGNTVTTAVANWRNSWPGIVPMPHPSPRNNLWLRRNPWFEADLLPQLQAKVLEVLYTRD